MSTHVCFERHSDLAQGHEERARMWLEDPAAAAGTQGRPSSAKTIRCALAQQKLAVREYREAARLRPRDVATQQRMAAAVKALRGLQEALEEPKPLGLRRFLAHYNLSIRYWDLGKAQQALIEAERACEELRKVGISAGCAEQNRTFMERMQAKYRAEHQRLLAAVQRSPEAVGPNYELGILYFDKRMLHRAEAQLKWARDCARAQSSLQLVEHDRERLQILASAEISPSAATLASVSPASVQGRRARERMCGLLDDLEDDLEFLGDLREKWCVEEEAGKAEELQETGVRDGARPHLLPCLHRRCDQDPKVCKACDRWWADLYARGELSQSAASQRKTQSCRSDSRAQMRRGGRSTPLLCR
eukprot:TRINITY_DN26569_c0_g4_i1.p1 TRINITY_DN26569_c0_g4~~TRINITY_DN26569_c0_g4_i1.p1  ORF type:complete len:361 (+),score=71.69 TRINITY_DN26569_c0_g4_i1:216-1298(+)